MCDYTHVYNIPDQIAIPDFPSGAMEHWGLITYRETALLYDPARVSTVGKERVAFVVAHELSHNVSYRILYGVYSRGGYSHTWAW